MSVFLRCFTLLCALCLTATAWAADAQPGQILPDKPAVSKSDRRTPVFVEHSGTDSIGAKLSYQLKELFNAGSMFTLTEKDTPKIRVLISTAPEFAERPAIGSVYAVVWVFSQSDGTLRHYLEREVGVVSAEDVPGLVSKLAERTDGIAAKYSYLFQN